MAADISKAKQTMVNMNENLVRCTQNIYDRVTPKANIINPLLEILRDKLPLYNSEYPKKSYEYMSIENL